MRLLFVTQKVDETDAVLGFTHRWIVEMAKHWEQVLVICLYEGTHQLPENVRVISLGKEKGVGHIGYVLRFYRAIIGELARYDVVFVHMNPEYFVLGGVLWKVCGKKTALWYSHKSTTWKLRVAIFFADYIFTTAPKSVTFESKKSRFVGHGIDVGKYRCSVRTEHDTPLVLTVGRITKIKQCETLIDAAAALRSRGMQIRVVIAGGPATEADAAYESELRQRVEHLSLGDIVAFTGTIDLASLLALYCEADISVNMVPTGGLDKSVIEAMAAGNLAISSNEAFAEYFGAYANRLAFGSADAKDLADTITELWHAPDREEIRRYLIKTADRFDVSTLLERISRELQEHENS